ncbi:uncharacterized protein LOC107646702 [Arachis ipaensis]|uniref:uncharacterized protein LOC107646702 n=1 Tax=Arachis ipaensis TaxID=130454 RepID=UPI0007AFB5B6|nr:uncharacterized protein LOC107646702 [Arachis ipaensis]XP_025661316.1 uncharacterized protein LOC112756926 [Arachis hypogaea]
MIGEEDALALEVQPTPEEVKEAVWDCESSKAPGSDSYNMNFIKRCWSEIGTEFTAAVMDFFLSSKLPADTNLTWVALAPKFTGAKEIKDLRPISMVGYVYKVISKILVRRMRAIMPRLVGETQSAFVKGRKIHDGALIACETVQWIKMRKKEAVIMKLGFQKAYDRVKWSFVDLVLQKMGFGRRWRSWVMECVSTSSMMLGEVVRNGRILPLLVGRDQVELSHLQFADDTWVQHMSRVLGCMIASLPVKYLGIPLGANPSLPVYYLSLYKMSKVVAEKLIFLQRRFLWSKEDGRNGMEMVRWEVVQAPKKLGGLGVGDAMVLPTRGGAWKDICQIQFKDQQLRQKMINGLFMEIGNGRGTRFWEDVWLRRGALKDLFPRLFSVSNQTGFVIGDCGFWDGLEWRWNFHWRRELFQWELDLENQIHETLRVVQLAYGREDKVV